MKRMAYGIAAATALLAGAYAFAVIVQPLKIEGGIGSTVAPVAVR